MIFLRPAPQQERWLLLADRYPSLHDVAEARAGGWTTPSLLSRVLMFVLGLFAASLIAGSLMWLPGRALVAGLVMIAGAEWLIRQRRLFAGGIEEALFLCGAVAIAVELLQALPGTGAVEWSLGLGVAMLAAGLRVGSALFVVLAAACLSFAVSDVGIADADSGSIAPMIYCVVVALAALLLGARGWQRPSHDRMLDGLVIAMPAAAQAWVIAEWTQPLRLATFAVDPRAMIQPALAIAFAAVLVAAGLRRRTHAPLLAALIQCAFLAYALRELTGMPLHARLLLSGMVLLAVGLALDRGLRRARGGFTSAKVDSRSDLEELAGVYGAAHLAPPSAPVPIGVEGQGGEFGGGGASGRF